MRILTRVIFVLLIILMLIPLKAWILMLFNQSFYNDLNAMSINEKYPTILSILLTTIFFVVYFFGAIGILFFRKWARTVLIFLPLIYLLLSWFFSFFVHFSHSAADLALIKVATFVAKFFMAIFFALSGYLLIPRVKRLFI